MLITVKKPNLSSWANMDLWQSPKSKPQILMLRSAEPVTRRVLSLDISIHRTGSLWPYSERKNWKQRDQVLNNILYTENTPWMYRFRKEYLSNSFCCDNNRWMTDNDNKQKWNHQLVVCFQCSWVYIPTVDL